MTGIPIHQGQLKNGLYQLFPSHVHPSTPQALIGEKSSSQCWHKRLGHPTLRIVNLILSKFQLPVSNKQALQPCTTCPQAKGHQLPFSPSTTSICNPLELLYSDVWGASPTLSLKGNRYYVSFVDAFSRFTWVYPMQSKSEVMPIFLKFQTMVERLLNAKIKSVQIDWGGEYRSLHTHFQSTRINHRISCPHTHQQGCVERKHRHLIETTLALLADSSLPKTFWDEAWSCFLLLDQPDAHSFVEKSLLLKNSSFGSRIINFLKFLGVLAFLILNPTIPISFLCDPNNVCS